MSPAPDSSIAFWRLGWRTLWRDVRAGELRLLVVAVMLAVAALTAVAFFSDRLGHGLQRDAAQLLGGDVVVSSDQEIAPPFIDKANALGLQYTRTQTFPTMARALEGQGGAGRLVTLKAVAPGYPLRGQLRTTIDSRWQPGMPDEVSTQPPAQGNVWVEAGLLDALGLQVGDDLLLGSSRLRIARVLTQEPDKGAGFVNFAPRVLMALEDLPATGLVQPASRVNYRLALLGPRAAVQEYARWASAETSRPDVHGIRVESLESGNPQMQQTLERAGNFLNLVALLAALLSAVAVALAARAFAARHLDDCAMLRVLGLPQTTIARAYAMEFLLMGVLGSLLGLLSGFVVHYAFVALLGNLVQTALPAPGWSPVLLGLGVGLTLLVAFGLPPVLQLAGTPPLRVIRRDLGELKAAPLAAIALGVTGFAILLLASSRDLKMGGIAVGGFALAVVVFMVLGWGAVYLLRHWVRSAAGARLPRWLALALRQLVARPGYAVVQISSLAVGLLALLLLVLLRTDLIDSWQRATPADAPNRFVINIMPDQAEAFQQMLRDAGVHQYDWYPMVRGRLVAVNGQPVSPQQYADDRARRLVDREFNLSFAAHPPAWNPVLQGQWRSGDAGAISMEQGIMDTLGLRLGDRLLFDMGGLQRTSTITSVRKVDWTSMHVNFFAMYPLEALGDDAAVTWITAYRAPAAATGQPGLDNRLLKAFPNITQVDMGSTIAQVRSVLDQVIRAVELLFGFGLAAGVAVLFATVNATRDERARELAIMRAVGAGSRLLGRIQNAELAGTGALAGLLASMIALLLGWVLARYVFEFEWRLAWWLVPAGGTAGAVLAWLAGWWSLRGILQRPVLQSLREAV